MTTDIEYRKRYTYIFVFFYLCEGFSQGIPFLLWPQYLAQVLGGSYNIPLWLVVYSIGNIPWAIKMIVGLFNDRIGSKKYGQRFPWIFSFGVFGGVWWIMMAFFLPTNDIYFWLAVYYFMTQLGMAFADTALDGLILDVTPKKKLARVQGYTWTVMFLGYGAGGMLLGLIFLATNLMPLLFILTGILMFISSFLPYLIKEKPLKEVSTKEFGTDLLTIVTKKRNWKAFLYTFFAAIPAVMILNFFMYVVLIAMGVIDVSSTILTIIGGGAVDLQVWSSIFYLVNGIGIIIGSPISGIFGDRSRKKTLTYIFLAYIPFCLILVLPFAFITGEILPLIFGMIFLLLIGAIQNAFTVINQTIRGDLAKNYYPNLKSTFFAILVGLSNLGQNLGTIIGAGLFAIFVLITGEFYLIFFLVSVFCAVSLILSYLIFNKIDPIDYELEKSISKS
ncbi:MAG: MFS transporter [Candidatus Lokiarchaeota archaeon]|nr:MFS transporter [Candidatus Lokiarchaeota archaeon]